MSVLLKVLPFTLKANGAFEQRGKSGQKGPAVTCNEGAGSQAAAALEGLMMGLVSIRGVPEQLIGKSCCKNVQSRKGQLLSWDAGKEADGSGTNFSSWEKHFSNLGGSPGPPLLKGKHPSKQEVHLPVVWCKQRAERQLRHEKSIAPTQPPEQSFPWGVSTDGKWHVYK